MKSIIPCSFVEAIEQDDIQNYLFKIEKKGQWFETQDCKPFLTNFEYRKVDYINIFADWLKSQPLIAARTGCWEEVTEIWRIVKRKKRVDKCLGDYMILVWSKEKGWVDTVYAGGIIDE